MNTFAIGEVAIYVRPGSPHFGTEVTILYGPCRFTNSLDYRTGRIGELFIGYCVSSGEVDLRGKDEWAVKTENLKKKQHKRPMDEKVSWDECLWKPAGVNA